MSVVAQKRRKSIAKAREYFELKEEAKTVIYMFKEVMFNFTYMK
jgi:hypothetical protein